MIARIKCDACGGVRQATTRRVLNADDAQIVEEDTAAQQERDLTLFRRWHQRRGTDPGVALEELRQRTGRRVLHVAEENGSERRQS
jgi:hypothetical protein